MPKKQTTAGKKARALQRAAGGKYTTLLSAQTCGEPVHPLDDLGQCARPPHPSDEPCSLTGDWDPTAWKQQEADRRAEAEARWEAMTPEEREEAEAEAWEWEYDDGGEGPSDWIDYQED